MKFVNHAIKACTLSLILFGGAAISQTLSLADNIPQAQQSNIVIAANTYKPGINRVTFQSEGETLVGNLYLPANYKQGDKLPTVIVTGAWMTIKEQMPATYAKKLAEQRFAAFAFEGAHFWRKQW